MAQSRLPPRARRLRARRSGRAHGYLLRCDDDGDAHDEGVQAQGNRGFHARSAPRQPARGHRPAAHARAARADGAAAQSALRARRGARLMPPALNPLDLVSKINRDVERSLLRARNGVRYVRGTHAPKLGTTPKDVVWKRGKAELWRYRNGPVAYGPPVLIVHSLVSRSYILDLRPGNSLVEFLTAAGLDVYMLDWGVPDELDADNDLERYVDFYLPHAVKAVLRESGSDEVTLMGYCLGGVLAALYAAAHRQAPVRNLILMATPVDFDQMGAMVAFLRDGRLNADELVDDTGNVPPDVLYSGFYMQAPTTEIAQKATLLDNL